MKKYISLLLIVFVFLGTGFGCTKNPQTTVQTSTIDERLIGSWETEGDFEEIILDKDGTFQTFLHDRPFVGGNWKTENNTLFLDGGSTGMNYAFSYTAIKPEESDMDMVNQESKNQETWTRVRSE